MNKLLLTLFLIFTIQSALAFEDQGDYTSRAAAESACSIFAENFMGSPASSFTCQETFSPNYVRTFCGLNPDNSTQPVCFQSSLSLIDEIEYRFFHSSQCPEGTLDDGNGFCEPAQPDCPESGTTQDLSLNFAFDVGQYDNQIINGCEATLDITFCALNTDNGQPFCIATATFNGNASEATGSGIGEDNPDGPDVTEEPPSEQLEQPFDTRESTDSSETDPPETQTNADGSTTTTTTTTNTQTTTEGVSGNNNQFTNHNETVTTTTTTTTTTTFTNGDININQDVTETNTGGGSQTLSINNDGSLSSSSTDDVNNTTTTNTLTNINSDGSSDSNTTGGDCVGEGCDDMGGGVCELAPILCDAAEFILETVDLPDHPDLPTADAESTTLDTGDFVAPTGQCIANPTVNVFGNSVELPFATTVCLFCDLMRPIMIVIASFVAVGVLLGGRSD